MDENNIGFGGNVSGAMEPKANPPLPRQKPKILNAGDDEETFSFIRGHEQPVPHLYKDNKGFMTIGAGRRIPTVNAAKELPLFLFENESAQRPATAWEIEKIYSQVRSIPHGQKVPHTTYNPRNRQDMQYIRLKDEDIDGMLRRDLHKHAQELRRNWTELDTLPPEAQRAMLDVHFNVGGSFTPKNWKGLKAALDDRDWNSVARELHRDTADEDRNIAVQDLISKIRD